ncbi:MAG: hypothetical protein KBE65_13315 [Phycisphaerae bacterium]|nr:hypothetical protein [Phycisphaerae bacterium]
MSGVATVHTGFSSEDRANASHKQIAVAYWWPRRAHRYEVGLIRQNLKVAIDQCCMNRAFSIG